MAQQVVNDEVRVDLIVPDHVPGTYMVQSILCNYSGVSNEIWVSDQEKNKISITTRFMTYMFHLLYQNDVKDFTTQGTLYYPSGYKKHYRKRLSPCSYPLTGPKHGNYKSSPVFNGNCPVIRGQVLIITDVKRIKPSVVN